MMLKMTFLHAFYIWSQELKGVKVYITTAKLVSVRTEVWTPRLFSSALPMGDSNLTCCRRKGGPLGVLPLHTDGEPLNIIPRTVSHTSPVLVLLLYAAEYFMHRGPEAWD